MKGSIGREGERGKEKERRGTEHEHHSTITGANLFLWVCVSVLW